LKGAIEDVQKIWKDDGKNKITPEAAIRHMGYKSMNGAAQVALSVLRKYGLLDGGKSGKVWVSDVAVDLIEGRNNPEVYRKALRKAAFLPTLFQELCEDFPESIPSAESMRFHLIKKGFNSDAATKAGKAFRETMELVTASGEGYAGGVVADDNAGGSTIAIGDLVQWESRGVVQFPAPRRVTGFSEDGEYAFIEGSATGVLTGELTRAQSEERAEMQEDQTKTARTPTPPAPPPPPAAPSALKVPPIAPPQPGFKQDVFTLPEGDVVLRWPEGLTKDGFEDVQGWLEVMQKKIARAVGAELKPQEKK
jgi:hypothetical protein